MNFEFFIAKRLIKGKSHKGNISSPIVKIAIFAIVVGMIMMLITVGTAIGLQHKIREKIAAFHGHINIRSYDLNTHIESWKPIKKTQDFYPEFKTVDGITHIQGVATKAGVIRTATDFEGVVIKGVDSDYDWEFFKKYLVEGSIPDFSNKLNQQILMSSYMANRLGLKIGDKAVTYFLKRKMTPGSRPNIRSFKIVGIYDSGFQEFDETFLFADIRHIRRMNKWNDDQVGHFEVFINDFDALESKGEEVFRQIPSDLEAQTIAAKYVTIFEWIKLFDFNIIGIIGIVILVAGINMITAMLVLILEKTPMIGIMKALGASDWSVRKIFIFNAAYLISVGLFWGNFIGLLLLWVQQKYHIISLDPATYYVDTAPIHIEVSHVLFLNLGTLLLCVLMLLIPSYVITKIRPINAIKFQ